MQRLLAYMLSCLLDCFYLVTIPAFYLKKSLEERNSISPLQGEERHLCCRCAVLFEVVQIVEVWQRQTAGIRARQQRRPKSQQLPPSPEAERTVEVAASVPHQWWILSAA
jgi:hypothetical protein